MKVWGEGGGKGGEVGESGGENLGGVDVCAVGGEVLSGG